MLRHPTLGNLVGLEFPLTVQYRNLPYAKFNGRFRESSLHNEPLSPDDTVYDATQWGPLCPQVLDGINLDFALAGTELPYAKTGMSEEKGLNVVVTIPRTIADGKLLPVLVWGYWVVGGNSWPQYGKYLQNFVELSSKRGRPVIAVAFNYRLGVLGLLASRELNSAGNFAIKDQALGFQWLRKHISGFGGDPDNITAFGQSAGAMLLSTLLQLSTPLFNKAVVMSGSATLRPSKTEKQQETLYNDVILALGLSEQSLEERKKALYEIPHDALLAKLPALIHVGPSIESGFLDDIVSLRTLFKSTSPSWCNEIVMGDCFHDVGRALLTFAGYERVYSLISRIRVYKASCFKTRILNKANNAEYFIRCIGSVLAPEEAKLLIDAYAVSPSDPSEVSLVKCMELVTDLRWYLPILYVDSNAGNGGPKISRYHFHQTNGIDCQWNGLAAHLFDIILLLQNHRHLLSLDEIALGDQMADRLLGLAYDDGFVSRNEDGGNQDKVVVWGPNGGSKLLGREEYDASLRKGRGKALLRLGAELCERLADTIQFGPSE
ncbi:Cholinesterase [Orbilia brochopaga]|nr:Cholinesterase [Drechslerella brochopaga]